MKYQTDDLRIIGVDELVPPRVLHEELMLNKVASETVYKGRQQAHEIIHGRDDRLLVVVGPCSIHDVDAALDYAQRLSELRKSLSKDLHILCVSI